MVIVTYLTAHEKLNGKYRVKFKDINLAIDRLFQFCSISFNLVFLIYLGRILDMNHPLWEGDLNLCLVQGFIDYRI